jgi:GNAT superfamily N-acetyltransferase
VHPDHEGRGYGTALLDTMVAWLWTLGHTQLTLATQPDTRAERFYAARGWERLGVLASGELRLQLVKR